jgi:hypothetical protein
VLRLLLIYAFIAFCPYLSHAQYRQFIEGRVVDKDTKMPLNGVVVSVSDIIPSPGSVTDENGYYTINNVPTGKHAVAFSYVGYQTVIIPGILIISGKETVLYTEMESSTVAMDEVTIAGRKEHINEMAMVSAKTFDVQETERYAGSRADPARMASNFAGVQGGDDSRNDITIRGNSPQGVLWRLEGLDILNPNHFAIPGTTGGPVSMLNSKTLANCDFFTGAFPAEYGDAVAGVFDLRLRNGNANRYEFTGQIGLLGIEAAAEGPLSKKSRSSFLFTYRYSTLQIFQALNINVGTTSIPHYQDATFKLNFPLGKKASISFFGIGGLSSIDLIVSKLTKPTSQLYGESDRDQYFKSNTGIIGTSLNYSVNATTFTKLSIGLTGNDIWAHHEKVFRDANFAVDSFKNILGYDFRTTVAMTHWSLTKKLSVKHTILFGIINNYYHVKLTDSSRQYPTTRPDWQYREGYTGGTDLVQGYVQYKYKPTDDISFTGGLHGQYLSHNGSKSVEPRLGARWRLSNSDVITFGYGLHSQMLSLYQYFAHLPQNSASAMHNYDVDFIRSHHIVAGYDHSFSSTWHAKLEIYYQYLFNVPIELRPGSSYSALNQGSSYGRDLPDTLKNAGTGYNKGIELTLEKRFTHNYYILLTGSLFDSKAQGNDGIYRNTDYNSHYALNILAGYEKKLGKNSVLIAGGKITYEGGRLYSPANVAASNAIGDYVVIDSLRNSLEFKPYFRADLKLGIRANRKKLTHEFAIDLINVLGTKNVLSLTYSSDLASQGNSNPFFTQYQLGFIPIFYYKIDFGLGAK